MILKNKRGIIFGIANDHSIAWGIAKQLHANGAELAITYQNDTLLKRVKPLADSLNCDLYNTYHIYPGIKNIYKDNYIETEEFLSKNSSSSLIVSASPTLI